MYLYLEDGSVFKGRSITSSQNAAGLVSYYTGVVGYQEMITDPANQGKLLLFTYPEIGNYGVNSRDAESSGPVVAGVIAKDYSPYYSNFMAEGSLKDYLESASVPFIDQVDTRAVLITLREKGEMWGVISEDELSASDIKSRIAEARLKLAASSHITCGNGNVEKGAAGRKAFVIDAGASRSFYKTLASRGVAIVDDEAEADLIIVSPAPFYAVDNAETVAKVKSHLGKKPVLGIADGAALVAAAYGEKPVWMGFGHHGVNLPARFIPTDRKEITVQNHHFIVRESSKVEILFDNVNDKTPEGYVIKEANAVGVAFIPDAVWFDDIMKVLEVR